MYLLYSQLFGVPEEDEEMVEESDADNGIPNSTLGSPIMFYSLTVFQPKPRRSRI
jgi:hypothetical protein